MTTATCGHKEHTPITTERQRGFFGAEYRRKKEGKKGRTKMGLATLRHHLEEAGGKNLPAHALSKSLKRRRNG